MNRHLAIFIATFAVGALAAVILRAALHQPYAQPAAPQAAAPAPAPAPVPAAAINTICAICAMPVDPTIETIAYKGQQIGFGCRMCPPKFRADPAKYGEAALKNQVVE